MPEINRITLDKTILNNSYQKKIFVELAYFKNTKVYQIVSPGFYGEFLGKNKIMMFKKYFEIRNKINKSNNKIKL